MKTTSILINAVSLFAALSIAIPAPIPATQALDENVPVAAAGPLVEARQTAVAPTARVQLEIESDTFVQEDVPANGSVFRSSRLSKGLVLGVAGASGGVAANRLSCRAFSDAAGKVQIVPGSATAASDLILTKNRAQPVSIGSIVCKTT